MRFQSFQILTLRFFPVKAVLILLMMAVFAGCKEYSDVEFLGLSNVQLSGFDGKELILTGNANFNNPNNTGVSLIRAEVEVLLDEKKVAMLEPDGKVRIGKNNEFTLPVKAKIDLSDGDTLSGLFNMLMKRSRQLELQGYVTVRKWLLPIKIDVEHKQSISF